MLKIVIFQGETVNNLKRHTWNFSAATINHNHIGTRVNEERCICLIEKTIRARFKSAEPVNTFNILIAIASF